MKVEIRKINKKNISDNYINWLKNNYVIRYTQQSFNKPTQKNLITYLKKINNSKTEFIFGIFSDNVHIGNIRLGPIIKNHKTAYIGFLIGEKKYWAKGIATIAINKICEIGFKKFKLNKINAACISINIGSQKCLKKNNFKIEGKLKSQLIYRKKKYDEIYFGLERKNFKLLFKN